MSANATPKKNRSGGNPIARQYHGNGFGDPARNTRFPYLAGVDLTKIVNMSLVLGRPLLVKGPPGCGKTRLAASIAHELDLPLLEWHVKSTSRARDGLYSIDMVRRLQDANLKDKKAQNLTPYIKFGPLGEAIRRGKPCVLLIDEIDKADLDFPNDLLRELDEHRFTIEELDESLLSPKEKSAGFRKTFEAAAPPIVIVTSNDEKELPDAFLRRCLFHSIAFPEKDDLAEIIRVNSNGMDLERTLAESAIKRLLDFRNLPGLRKQPSTSELLDWVHLLHHWKIPLSRMEGSHRLKELPFWESLFKHQEDIQRVGRADTGS